VLLSGDVHYGFTVNVTVDAEGRALPLTQLVSSPLHHSGTSSRYVLTGLGIMTRERHERIGWRHPPALEKPTKLRRKLLERPSNHDEWNEDSPVFVSPQLARRVGVAERPQFREWRDYAPIDEAKTSLVALNNVGWLSLRDGIVTHRLIARRNGRIETFTTKVDAKDDDSDDRDPTATSEQSDRDQ
jgi:hypothetical protein